MRVSTWSDSPYLNHFVQPDTIIPDASNPQSWNRYSYVENDPINYSDTSGHFKCINASHNAAYNGSNCQRAVESLLTLLAGKGGKEGQALVEAFREADVATVCGSRHRGGAECHVVKDQITITITDDSEPGYEANSNSYEMGQGYLDSSQLSNVGVFGHETQHLVQATDPAYEGTGVGPGSLYGELDAYVVERKLQENMGIAGKPNNPREWISEIADYEGASPKDILKSRWATEDGGTPCGYYSCRPLYSTNLRRVWFGDGGRNWDNSRYLK